MTFRTFQFTLFLLLASTTFSQVYLNPNAPTEARVNDLLSQMTLQEKVGQMTQAERGSVEASGNNHIQQYFLGSVLSGGGSVPNPNSPLGWVNMYNNMQDKALATRLAIPIIYGVDAVHGHNNVYGATIFPHNIGLGCTRNPELVENCARVTALEVKATGLNWTFSPCVAVPQNEFWGRTYEGFGESPSLVDSLGLASIMGYQSDSLGAEGGIMACAKHFVADGGTENGHDQGNAVMSEDELREVHLPPYISAVDAGVGSVMISYSSWNGAKCHGSSTLINGILKDELGFDGIVLSDWNGINQVNGDFKAAIKQSVNAGIDMAMQPDNYIPFIEHLTALVNEGQVSIERIDDAVSRILTAKFELGLFENPYADLSLADTVGCSTHRDIARQAVRESLVLLKDDGILPLPKTNTTILVAGSKGNDVGAMCGGWTISWQGGLGNITEGTTVLEGFQQMIGSENVVYTSNSGQIPNADYAVVVVGENPYAEGAGDLFGNVGGFGLSSQDKQMIQAVKNNGIPMVVVLLSGRPLDISDALDDADAFIAAWLPGTEGGSGIAEIVFGDYTATGKLSHTWPESYYDVPINIIGNYPGHDALFPYGYGLVTTSSVDENFIDEIKFEVYPNPVVDDVFIRTAYSGPVNFKVLDVMGNILINKEELLNCSTNIKVGELKPGIYFLQITDGRYSLTRKILKQ
jgi:beta-glucosidase